MKQEKDEIHLENELENLEKMNDAENAMDRRTLVTTLAISALILFIIGGFFLANYLHFKSEWTEEKFASSLNRELEYLKPTVSREIEVLGRSLMPVYAEETRKQFPEMAPVIADKIGEEVDRFCDEFQTDVNAKLHVSGDSLQRKILANIFESYPHLDSEAEQQALMTKFRQSTDDVLASAIAHFDQKFSADVHEFQRTLHDVPETNEPMVELQKRFIQLWIKLLDKEVTKL